MNREAGEETYSAERGEIGKETNLTRGGNFGTWKEGKKSGNSEHLDDLMCTVKTSDTTQRLGGVHCVLKGEMAPFEAERAANPLSTVICLQ